MFQPAASPRPPLSRRFGPAGAELSHRAPTASYAACVSLASRISLKVNDAPAPHPMDSSMLTARGRERKRSWVRHCPYSNINYLSVVETTFSAHCAMILILYVFNRPLLYVPSLSSWQYTSSGPLVVMASQTAPTVLRSFSSCRSQVMTISPFW